jgi:hypothetical protein
MRQADLFSATKAAPTPQPEVPDPDAIRARLHAWLTEARGAATMPWEPTRAHVKAMVFHNMANWLPEAERDALRRAFAAEMARLGVGTLSPEAEEGGAVPSG